MKGNFTYKVARVHVVKPSQVEVLNPTPTPTLTLTTCHPKYSAKERLIVVANLAPGQTATAATPPPPTDPAEQGAGLPGDALADAGLASDRSKVTTTLWGLLDRGHRHRLVGRHPPRGATGSPTWAASCRSSIALFFFYAHLELLLPANF